MPTGRFHNCSVNAEGISHGLVHVKIAPTQSPTRSRRSLWRTIHLWWALIIGFPVALIAASGFFISYWGASDAWFDRSFYGVGRSHATHAVDFDQLARAALSVPGAQRLKIITLQRDGQTAIAVITFGDRIDREVSVDPATATILGVRDPQNAVIFRLYSLHTRLMLDRLGFDGLGRVALIVIAVNTILLLLSGVVLWWPRRWRSELLLPVLRRDHRWRDWHNKSGLYACVPLTLAAATAILLSLPVTRELGTSPQVPLVIQVNPISQETPLTLNDFVRPVTQSLPDLAVTGLGRLDERGSVLVYAENTQGDTRWVVVDRQRLSIEAVRTADPFTRETDPSFLIGLHQGHRWSAIGQAVFAFASLLPIGLYVTGLVLWIRRRGRSGAKRLPPLG